MKKNNKMKKITITIAIIILLIGTIAIIGENTYSKYYTKIDGIGNAEIARWSFKANNEKETISDIELINIYNENKIKKNTIAPGTKGSFDIVLDTTGADVAIDYAVTFDNLKNKPTNLIFTYDGTTADTLKGLEDVLKGRIGLNDSRTKTLTIYWEWAYQTGISANEIADNDKIDTADAGKEFTFDITIEGVQVNPSEKE